MHPTTWRAPLRARPAPAGARRLCTVEGRMRCVHGRGKVIRRFVRHSTSLAAAPWVACFEKRACAIFACTTSTSSLPERTHVRTKSHTAAREAPAVCGLISSWYCSSHAAPGWPKNPPATRKVLGRERHAPSQAQNPRERQGRERLGKGGTKTEIQARKSDRDRNIGA